ncbi:MAG: RNA-binding cell elongation regulator Jag/EloR [Desulfobacterales bacterium]
MTAEMEFKARNVNKAVQLAAKTLGISAENLEYDVLSHGSTGIFGLAGVKKARIKVHPPEMPDVVEELGPEMPHHFEAVSDLAPPDSDEEPGEAQRVGEAVLRRMVDAISPEAHISVEKSDRHLRFEIKGGQSGILIGKRGQTLEAMQLIVDKAVRRLNGHAPRLTIDVEGYLAKKKAGLIRTAERLAKKVVSKGSPSSIGYLNAQDRRIIHLAFKHDQKVRTQSVGEGPLRKLMIYPRRKPRTKI